MKKNKASLLMLGAALAAGALAGCTPKNVKKAITLSCTSEVSEVERHSNLQFSVELENVKAEEVTYVVSSDVATINAQGKLTVKDNAAIGSQFSVTAEAGEVKSNALSYTVVDTKPSQILVTPSQTSIKEGDKVTFSASYYPSYSSITAYNLSIVEGETLAEITEDKELQLKDGITSLDHEGEKIKVRASLQEDPEIKSDVEILIGQFQGSLSVSNVNIISRKQNEFQVNPSIYDEAGHLVDPTFAFHYASSDADVFTVSETGVITGKGHGTATLTVTYADLEATATVNVIVSPESISVEGLNDVIRTKGLKFATSSAYTLNIHADKEDKYSKVSDAYSYDLKLFDADQQLITDNDAEIATINGNKFTFLQTGNVQLDIKSNSSLGDEDTTGYEVATSMKFVINEGANVSTFAELRTALANPSVRSVNFLNDMNLTADDFSKDSSGFYNGLTSFGNKEINGNDFILSMKAVDLNEPSYQGTNAGHFIQFLPAEGHHHEPYNVNITDFHMIGNTDLNGYYNGTGAGTGKNAYNMETNKFVGSFRSGLFIGTFDNGRQHFITKNGVEITEEQAPYWGAYVNHPVLTNVEVDGFYWGIWAHHIVDGEFVNFKSVNSFEKGVLAEQSMITFHNPWFDQNGAFCVENTEDGINNMARVAAPENPGDVSWATEPTAGANYDQVPTLNMTGDIHVDNYNSGNDTTYMAGYSQQLQAMTGGAITDIPDLLQKVYLGTIQAILADSQFDGATPQQKETIQNALINLAAGIVSENDKVNFFALSYLLDMNLNANGESPDKYCLIKEDGQQAITLKNILIASAVALATTGGVDLSYKTHKYIDVELYLGSMGHMGKAVIINQDYEPANN